MSETQIPTVKAVQDSMISLLDLLEQSMRTTGRTDFETVKTEVQETVLKFIAAIVLSDKKYDEGEQAFVRALVDFSKKPGGEIRYLNEYAEAWKTCRFNIPEFIKIAADHDRKYKTEIARAMLRELQLIGNNASVSDGVFAAIEHETIHDYLLSLERFLATHNLSSTPILDPNASGWTSL